MKYSLKRTSAHFLLTNKLICGSLWKTLTASVCDTLTQPVGGLSTASKDFTGLSGVKQTASPSSSFTTRLDIAHTHTQTLSSALSLSWKHSILCIGFEQPWILAPYEEESKFLFYMFLHSVLWKVKVYRLIYSYLQ